MNTPGLLCAQDVEAIGRPTATGQKRSMVMFDPYDLRASRTAVMMARKWTDDEDDHRPRKARGASGTRRSISPRSGTHDSGTPRSGTQDDATDELEGSQWDEVADVICAGRGRLGLAIAVAVQRAGLDVMLADGPGHSADGPALEPVGHLAGLLGVTDEETVAYLQALTEDITPVPTTDPTIPVRVVDGPIHPDLTTGPLETFNGAALMQWTQSCMASAYGLLYTRVTDPKLALRYTGVDGSVDATVLDTIDIDPERPADSFEFWLSTLERDFDGELPTSGALQRLVFEDGVVTGAVLETDSGVLAVRARHGVMLALGDGPSPSGLPDDLDRREPAEVAVVSRAASRFSRLELLTRALR